MSINSAHNRLKHAQKELVIRWETVQQQWHDENARHFGQQFLLPLLERVRAAHDAMVHLESVLTQVRQDCE